MMQTFKAFGLAVLAATGAVAVPTFEPPVRTLETRQTGNGSACAIMAEAATAYFAGNTLGLRPSVVYSCLTSVPFNSANAVALIDWMTSALQWQSTLDYLKNPPSSYQLPAVDVLGGLSDIRSRAQANQYSNQFEFENAIQTLLVSTNDGHLSMSPILPAAFRANRDIAFVTLSADGATDPQVYVWTDLARGTVNASNVVSISGKSIEQGLGLGYQGYQDLDAMYNALMFRSYSPGGYFFTAGLTDLNDTTTVTFANGTSINRTNIVFPPDNLNFTGIRNGADIYSKFILPAPETTATSSASRTLVSSTAPATTSVNPTAASSSRAIAQTRTLRSTFGYPTPVIETNELGASGYYLNGSTDTAVLNVATFVLDQRDFQNKLRQFLAMCKTAGKTKLIIDVRGNGGGSSYLGFELFRQLFPTLPLYNKARFRAHPQLDAVGRQFSVLPLAPYDNITLLEGPKSAYSNLEVVASFTEFNAGNNLMSTDGRPFSNWTQLYGPVTENDGNWTNFLSENFNSSFLDLLQSDGIVLSGYGNNTNVAPAVFAQQNVTLLSDGICSSTCTLLSNLIIFLTNASTIAVGGRINNSSSMPIVGGVAGAQEQNFGNIGGYTYYALNRSETIPGSLPIDAATKQLLNTTQSDPPLNLNLPVKEMAVNLKDQFMPDSDVPMQFRSIPAGCRIYYRPIDILNTNTFWTHLATGNYTCIGAGKKAGQQTNPNYIANPLTAVAVNTTSGGPGTGSGSGTGGATSPNAGMSLGTSWTLIMAIAGVVAGFLTL